MYQEWSTSIHGVSMSVYMHVHMLRRHMFRELLKPRSYIKVMSCLYTAPTECSVGMYSL